MYCANCGVKLADTEARCPLCGTRAYHPDLQREPAEPLYPAGRYPDAAQKKRVWSILLTVLFALPIPTVLICDLRFGDPGLTWSGIVVGALCTLYVMSVLPTWFERPNPVIFVPCSFAAVGGYLWLLDYLLSGVDWFWTFALPVTGGVAVIVCAVVTLMRYVRRGQLFIFGGALVAFGGLMLLIEFLMTITFPPIRFVAWSLYPLSTFVLIGGWLIFLGICRPARELMQRKFFI